MLWKTDCRHGRVSSGFSWIANQKLLLLLGVLLLSLFISLATSVTSSALTTVPTKMHFQGRLTDTTGNIKPDGNYNMKLRVYDALSGGILKYSEDRLVSAGSPSQVTVSNGLFSLKIGEGTNKTGTFDASIFASGGLYLEMELATPATATSSSPVWTEGAMTPRNELLTSAYAYNADTLDGLDSDAFAQLTTNNTWTGTNIFNGANVSIGGVTDTSKFSVGTVLGVDTVNSKVSVNGSIDQTVSKLTLKSSSQAGVSLRPQKIEVVNDVAYTVGLSSGGSVGSVALFDVSNPANPIGLGSSTGSVYNGASDIKVSGSYAYVTTNTDKLIVLDVSRPGINTVTSITDNTYLDQAAGLEIQGKYAYIAASNGANTNGFLTVVDISNPSAPSVVASLNHADLRQAKQVDIQGKYAYVTSGATDTVGGFTIIDISNPLNPTLTDSYMSADYRGAQDIDVKGKYAYVVGSHQDYFGIFNISNPSNISIAGYIQDSVNMDEPHDISLNGRYAYVASRSSNAVTVIELADLPFNSSIISTLGYGHSDLLPIGTYLDGRYLYVVSDTSNAGISQFHVLDTGGTSLLGTSTNSLHTETMQVEGSADIGDNLNVGDALFVGLGGIMTNGSLTVGSSVFTVDTTTSTVRVGNATNNITFSVNGMTRSGAARGTKTISLIPEYPGATFAGDGTNNTGSLSSDFCSSTSLMSINTNVCNNPTDERNYYSWTTAEAAAQDYDLYVRYRIPTDYDTGSMTNLRFWAKGTSTTTDIASLALHGGSSTACSTITNAVTINSTWAESAQASPLGSCTIIAGDYVTFKIKLTAGQNNTVHAGAINFTYRSNN